jgi:ribosomal protein S18 acetylase RimI-like enzyme
MIYEILELSPHQVEMEHDQIVRVYAEAFAAPPYLRDDADAAIFSLTLSSHTQREGFKMLAARPAGQTRIDGFAYGYITRPGQWWHEQVKQAMPPEMAADWLDGSFELVELAVSPIAQGQRLGSRLHDGLLDCIPYSRALLSTRQEETTALKLYRKRGWVPLVSNFLFAGHPMPYQIMGLILPG